MKRLLLTFLMLAVTFLLGSSVSSVYAYQTNQSWVVAPGTYLSGTTSSIGGSLLSLGGTASGTASVVNSTIGMPCLASPSDGTNIAGLGMSVECTVTVNGTATVNIVAFVTVTPPAKTYNVRVLP